MAQVTVEQLAETVGASVDRLLSQMKDAGLPHAAADEAVSEEDKQTLLAHLKQSHGEREGAPKENYSEAQVCQHITCWRSGQANRQCRGAEKTDLRQARGCR